MKEEIFENALINLEFNIQLIKTIFLAVCTYWSILKITNKNTKSKKYKYLIIILIAILSEILQIKLGFLIGRLSLVLLISTIYSRKNITNSILTTIIAFSLNYILMIIAILLATIFNLNGVKNDIVNFIIIITIYLILITIFFKIKKFKYGISFLHEENINEDMDSLTINICINILLIILILYNSYGSLAKVTLKILIISAIVMFVNIYKALSSYYKKRLLVKELEETKKELEIKNAKIKDMENEILSFSKKSHSIAHMQKSLEYKINKIAMNYEFSEELDLRDRLKDISKNICNSEEDIIIDKTNVKEIDDILEYMKSEAIKNNIKFNVKIYKNINFMTTNIITKNELEILIADTVKNAIIAINHSQNENREILIKLGKIDAVYGIYIYDTGIDFPKTVIENIGKQPITTHKDEGGTGMGLINTFETLNKYEASLIIEKMENKFTKVLKIKFDKLNEFKSM